jgi:copper chaperone CopZ
VSEKVYRVNGMTCGHCVDAVQGEVGKVAGVQTVTVDLARGAVTVAGTGFTDEQVAAAVDEAGYELAGA